MEKANCLRCNFRHEDNGNCTAVGGFCTAVAAAHCPLLRQYLDTRLTPEEIERVINAYGRGQTLRTENALRLEAVKDISTDRLRELAEADKDGRLVVLPVKTVFELTWDAGPDCDLTCPVSVDGEGCCSFCDKGELCIYERKCRQEHIEQIGKTVFLTREEARRRRKHWRRSGMGIDGAVR